MNRIFFTTVILFSVTFLNCYCQQKADYIIDLEKKAETQFYNGEFKLAYANYYKLWSRDSTNIDYNYYLAVSNIEENINSKAALHNLMYVFENDKSYDNLCFYLARAHMLSYQFTDAINLFNKFKTECNDRIRLSETERYINSCNNAISLLNNPVNISFENLGPAINSSKDDFTPFVTPDESTIIFTSNKKYDPDYDTFIENIYVCVYENGKWQNGKNQSYINTGDNEYVMSVFNGGEKIFLCSHLDMEFSDILIAEKKGNTYKYDKNNDYMFNNLNTKNQENGASMTQDGETIFLSSNRDGGIGGSDIYIMRKLPDGSWGKAENTGNTINTESDEAFPNISPDGGILYFASKGHNSIGGYDLFVSYWNITHQEWTTPINLGFPINTTDNNTTISFSGNKRYAYISANRNEGSGGMDIYRITFEDADKEYTVFKSHILAGDSIQSKPFNPNSDDLTIDIFDSYGNLYGQYLPKRNSSDFIAILPVGKFEIEINHPDYSPLIETIEVLGKSDYKKELDKYFYISPNN
ncbi:MAG: hypothetical protein ABIJ97_15495 [Bacteroidota bacterium]